MSFQPYNHEFFMREALKEAQKALDKEEVPVGAVVVCDNRIIARSHNLTETLNDPTAHAEMQAITSATGNLGGKYLNQCTLYVTLEPCVMCAGAIFWAQVKQLVYGASDPKRGFSTLQSEVLHPKTEVINGVLANETGAIVTNFFRQRRKLK
ncbi:MAG: nucleoside deaminase [Tenuifilaceae bacterium]|jgi:tRNA(adenine34) deaminase|nr:nucleoside deaminase [Tenuifilaceae bacterium]